MQELYIWITLVAVMKKKTVKQIYIYNFFCDICFMLYVLLIPIFYSVRDT